MDERDSKRPRRQSSRHIKDSTEKNSRKRKHCEPVDKITDLHSQDRNKNIIETTNDGSQKKKYSTSPKNDLPHKTSKKSRHRKRKKEKEKQDKSDNKEKQVKIPNLREKTSRKSAKDVKEDLPKVNPLNIYQKRVLEKRLEKLKSCEIKNKESDSSKINKRVISASVSTSKASACTNAEKSVILNIYQKSVIEKRLQKLKTSDPKKESEASKIEKDIVTVNASTSKPSANMCIIPEKPEILNIYQKSAIEKRLTRLQNERNKSRPNRSTNKIPAAVLKSDDSTKTKSTETPKDKMPVAEIKNLTKPKICFKLSKARKSLPNIADQRMKDFRNQLSKSLVEGSSKNKLTELHNKPKRKRALEVDSNDDTILLENDKCCVTLPTSKVQAEESTNLNTEDVFSKNKTDIESSKKDASLEVEMDWESVVEEINQSRDDLKIQNPLNNFKIRNKQYMVIDENPCEEVVIVIDTNIFISHLKTIQDAANLLPTADCHRYVFMVPWRVLCELDGLKTPSEKGSPHIQYMARQSMNYLNANLQSNERVRGQSLKDAHNELYPCRFPDDEILNCCLQQVQSGRQTILLTNDTNLSNKGIVNNITTYTHKQFESFIQKNKTADDKKTSESSRSVVNFENINDKLSTPYNEKKHLVDNSQQTELIESMNSLLSAILKDQMESQFGSIWLKIVLIEPPWTLTDLLRCILKHWMAVFREVFPKDLEISFKQLQYHFPSNKKDTVLSKTALCKVANLCLKLVNFCKSMSKYEDAVKNCLKNIDEILNSYPNEDISKCEDVFLKTNATANEVFSKANETFSEIDDCQANTEDASDRKIFDIFQTIWNGMSAFCLKIAASLGVPHNLDESIELTGASMDELIPQADSVSNQLLLIVKSITIVLQVCAMENSLSMTEATEAFANLRNVIYATLIGMGRGELKFDDAQLSNFVFMHRNVLEEGRNKFELLYQLLLECSYKYSSIPMDL